MTEDDKQAHPAHDDVSAADPSLTRKQFLERVVKGAALTGGALAAPRILDKFLVPPAYAQTSTVCIVGENTSGGIDSVIQTVGTSDIVCIPTSFFTACTAGGDTDPAYHCP